MCNPRTGTGLNWVRRAIAASVAVHATTFGLAIFGGDSTFLVGRVWCAVIAFIGGVSATIAYVSLDRFLKDVARRETAATAIAATPPANCTPQTPDQPINRLAAPWSEAQFAPSENRVPESGPTGTTTTTPQVNVAPCKACLPIPTTQPSAPHADPARLALERTRAALGTELRDYDLTDDELDERDAQAAAAARAVRVTGNVLLVEDAEDNQHLIKRFLRQAGVKVALAHNGEEGVKLALAGDFDLVLMDMQMPVMDGYRATAELRRQGYVKPIVALTAHALADDRLKCISAGCSDYLSKPIDRQKLLMTCAGYLHGATPSEIAAAEPASTPPAAAQDSPATGPLRSALAGDKRLGRILDKFVARLPERVAQIMTCLDSGDLETLRQAVHNLKGAGAGYGFGPLSEQAARAEETLKEIKSLEDIRRETESLISLIERVEGYTMESAATPTDSSTAL